MTEQEPDDDHAGVSKASNDVGRERLSDGSVREPLDASETGDGVYPRDGDELADEVADEMGSAALDDDDSSGEGENETTDTLEEGETHGPATIDEKNDDDKCNDDAPLDDADPFVPSPSSSSEQGEGSIKSGRERKSRTGPFVRFDKFDRRIVIASTFILLLLLTSLGYVIYSPESEGDPGLDWRTILDGKDPNDYLDDEPGIPRTWDAKHGDRIVAPPPIAQLEDMDCTSGRLDQTEGSSGPTGEGPEVGLASNEDGVLVRWSGAVPARDEVIEIRRTTPGGASDTFEVHAPGGSAQFLARLNDSPLATPGLKDRILADLAGADVANTVELYTFLKETPFTAQFISLQEPAVATALGLGFWDEDPPEGAVVTYNVTRRPASGHGEELGSVRTIPGIRTPLAPPGGLECISSGVDGLQVREGNHSDWGLVQQNRKHHQRVYLRIDESTDPDATMDLGLSMGGYDIYRYRGLFAPTKVPERVTLHAPVMPSAHADPTEVPADPDRREPAQAQEDLANRDPLYHDIHDEVEADYADRLNESGTYTYFAAPRDLLGQPRDFITERDQFAGPLQATAHDLEPPGIPRGVDVTVQEGTREVTVTWEPAERDPVRYFVQRAISATALDREPGHIDCVGVPDHTLGGWIVEPEPCWETIAEVGSQQPRVVSDEIPGAWTSAWYQVVAEDGAQNINRGAPSAPQPAVSKEPPQILEGTLEVSEALACTNPTQGTGETRVVPEDGGNPCTEDTQQVHLPPVIMVTVRRESEEDGYPSRVRIECRTDPQAEYTSWGEAPVENGQARLDISDRFSSRPMSLECRAQALGPGGQDFIIDAPFQLAYHGDTDGRAAKITIKRWVNDGGQPGVQVNWDPPAALEPDRYVVTATDARDPSHTFETETDADTRMAVVSGLQRSRPYRLEVSSVVGNQVYGGSVEVIPPNADLSREADPMDARLEPVTLPADSILKFGYGIRSSPITHALPRGPNLKAAQISWDCGGSCDADQVFVVYRSSVGPDGPYQQLTQFLVPAPAGEFDELPDNDLSIIDYEVQFGDHWYRVVEFDPVTMEPTKQSSILQYDAPPQRTADSFIFRGPEDPVIPQGSVPIQGTPVCDDRNPDPNKPLTTAGGFEIDVTALDIPSPGSYHGQGTVKIVGKESTQFTRDVDFQFEGLLAGTSENIVCQGIASVDVPDAGLPLQPIQGMDLSLRSLRLEGITERPDDRALAHVALKLPDTLRFRPAGAETGVFQYLPLSFASLRADQTIIWEASKNGATCDDPVLALDLGTMEGTWKAIDGVRLDATGLHAQESCMEGDEALTTSETLTKKEDTFQGRPHRNDGFLFTGNALSHPPGGSSPSATVQGNGLSGAFQVPSSTVWATGQPFGLKIHADNGGEIGLEDSVVSGGEIPGAVVRLDFHDNPAGQEEDPDRSHLLEQLDLQIDPSGMVHGSFGPSLSTFSDSVRWLLPKGFGVDDVVWQIAIPPPSTGREPARLGWDPVPEESMDLEGHTAELEPGANVRTMEGSFTWQNCGNPAQLESRLDLNLRWGGVTGQVFANSPSAEPIYVGGYDTTIDRFSAAFFEQTIVQTDIAGTLRLPEPTGSDVDLTAVLLDPYKGCAEGGVLASPPVELMLDHWGMRFTADALRFEEREEPVLIGQERTWSHELNVEGRSPLPHVTTRDGDSMLSLDYVVHPNGHPLEFALANAATQVRFDGIPFQLESVIPSATNERMAPIEEDATLLPAPEDFEEDDEGRTKGWLVVEGHLDFPFFGAPMEVGGERPKALVSAHLGTDYIGFTEPLVVGRTFVEMGDLALEWAYDKTLYVQGDPRAEGEAAAGRLIGFKSYEFLPGDTFDLTSVLKGRLDRIQEQATQEVVDAARLDDIEAELQNAVNKVNDQVEGVVVSAQAQVVRAVEKVGDEADDLVKNLTEEVEGEVLGRIDQWEREAKGEVEQIASSLRAGTMTPDEALHALDSGVTPILGSMSSAADEAVAFLQDAVAQTFGEIENLLSDAVEYARAAEQAIGGTGHLSAETGEPSISLTSILQTADATNEGAMDAVTTVRSGLAGTLSLLEGLEDAQVFDFDTAQAQAALEQALTELDGAIETMAPVSDGVDRFITETQGYITILRENMTALRTILEDALELFTEARQKVESWIETVADAQSTMESDFLAVLERFESEAATDGSSAVNDAERDLLVAIEEAAKAMKDPVSSLIGEVQEAATGTIDDVVIAALGPVDEAFGALKGAVGELRETMDGIIEKAFQELEGKIDDAIGIVADEITALINGFTADFNEQIAGIASKSKLFYLDTALLLGPSRFRVDAGTASGAAAMEALLGEPDASREHPPDSLRQEALEDARPLEIPHAGTYFDIMYDVRHHEQSAGTCPEASSFSARMVCWEAAGGRVPDIDGFGGGTGGLFEDFGIELDRMRGAIEFSGEGGDARFERFNIAASVRIQPGESEEPVFAAESIFIEIDRRGSFFINGEGIEAAFISDTASIDVTIDVQFEPFAFEGGFAVHGIDFQALKIQEAAAALGAGTEAESHESFVYLGLKFEAVMEGGAVGGATMGGTLLFGKVPKDSRVLALRFPDAMEKIGEVEIDGNVLTGAYARAGGLFPIVDYGCFLRAQGGGEVAFWVWLPTDGSPVVGGRLRGDVTGTVICAISARGAIILEYSQHGDYKRMTGAAWVAGGIGFCEPETWDRWEKRWWSDSWCWTAGAYAELEYVTNRSPAWTYDYEVDTE